MLVIGAKGFAKEVLEILHQNGDTENLCFYDDVSADSPEYLFGKFPIVKNLTAAQDYFKKTDQRFAIGIGKPDLRQKVAQQFTEIGGVLTTTISKNAEVGSFNVEIAEGCNILGGVKISNDVRIGRGTMIYYNSIITHDVSIGRFCEISPDVKLLGRCRIGDSVQIGAGAVIFPDVEIGSHSVVAAGAVVRKNVPTRYMVAGVPAELKKVIT